MTVSHNARQREAHCRVRQGLRDYSYPPPPAVSTAAVEVLERESGELLIPCTIGHLNPDRHHIYTQLKLSPSLMTEPAEGSPLASQPAIHNS